LHGQFVIGKADEVQGRQRPGVHGIDIGKRVGGRDLAIDERVVEQGGEKVDRLDERGAVVQQINAGVVTTFDADKPAFGRWVIADEVTQNLRERPGGDLAGSAGAVGVVGESFLP